jgi:hypothetical protein
MATEEIKKTNELASAENDNQSRTLLRVTPAVDPVAAGENSKLRPANSDPR